MSSALPLEQDTDIGSLVLDVATKNLVLPGVSLGSRVTDGSIDRTMAASSTLTIDVDDTRHDLLRSGVFSQQIDLELDGQWWRLTAVSKTGTSIELTFEDRIIAYLKAKSGPKKASRSSTTRAEFILSLVQELTPPVPFVCPELTTVQKVAITSSTGKVSPIARSAALGQGLAAGVKLTVKGAPATPEQRAMMQRVLDVANSLNAGQRPTIALLEACIVESTFINYTTPSSDGYGSYGILQVRKVYGDAMGCNGTDPEQCAHFFLAHGFAGPEGAIVYAAKNPDKTYGQIAQYVEGSQYPGRYDQYQAEAEAILAAYTGEPASSKSKAGSTPLPAAVPQTSNIFGPTPPGTTPGAIPKAAVTAAAPFQFQRGGTNGKRENSWACMQRLAQQVGWECFVVDGRIYYASDTTLIQQMPELTISEDVLGVDGIDFNVDNGKDTSEATVTARASRWAVPPGSCVELYDCGPADGRWLVKEVSRGLFDAQATITLARATLPLPEPATDPSSTAAAKAAASGQPFGTTPGLATTGGSPLARAYAAAQALTAKQYPYIWGGGHAHAGTPDNPRMVDPQTGQVDPGIGFDCSGLQGAMLAAAGMGFKLGDPVPGSGTFASSWGEPGEGKQFTLWASSVHVWSAFKEPAGWHHFGTGDWGSHNEFLGFKPEMHPTAGFTPRHWKDT